MKGKILKARRFLNMLLSENDPRIEILREGGKRLATTMKEIVGMVASGVSNDDGRVAEWNNDFELMSGNYMLSFDVSDYFASQEKSSFYADIQIKFKVAATDEHYHVPLLLNPFGYSTYRGS